jgi:type IV secretory pathway VirB2 component (pilin)
MINKMVSLGYGIIVLAILIGVGSLILANFGNAAGGTSNTTVQYLLTTLGSTNGGLASWVPTVIVVFIGLLFLGAFMIGRGVGQGK